MSKQTTVSIGSRVFVVLEMSDHYDVFERIEKDLVDVSPAMANRVVCEMWEPSGRYSGT
jgi:hypothetical protein